MAIYPSNHPFTYLPIPLITHLPSIRISISFILFLLIIQPHLHNAIHYLPDSTDVSLYPSACPSIIYPSIHDLYLIYASFCPSFLHWIQSSICPFTRPFNSQCPSHLHSLTNPSAIHSTVHPSIHFSVCPSIYCILCRLVYRHFIHSPIFGCVIPPIHGSLSLLLSRDMDWAQIFWSIPLFSDITNTTRASKRTALRTAQLQ